VKFGGGKVIRDGMVSRSFPAGTALSIQFITNALILDHWGIVKAISELGTGLSRA